MKIDGSITDNFDLYINNGLFDIYLVEKHENESSDHVDYVYEEIVARQSNGFVRVKVQTRYNSYPGHPPKVKYDITSIEHAIYEQQRSSPNSKFIVGSDNLTINKIIEKRRCVDDLTRQIDEKAPQCPFCDSKMTIRDGKYGFFWGCPRFGRCRQKGTEMSSDVKDKINERKSLLDSVSGLVYNDN